MFLEPRIVAAAAPGAAAVTLPASLHALAVTKLRPGTWSLIAVSPELTWVMEGTWQRAQLVQEDARESPGRAFGRPLQAWAVYLPDGRRLGEAPAHAAALALALAEVRSQRSSACAKATADRGDR